MIMRHVTEVLQMASEGNQGCVLGALRQKRLDENLPLPMWLSNYISGAR